jgi:CheY-like chemotaxis protein
MVDDDAALRDVFADFIRGLGYQVNVVGDAGELPRGPWHGALSQALRSRASHEEHTRHD